MPDLSVHLTPASPLPDAHSPAPAGILRHKTAYPESTAAETGELPRSPAAGRRPTGYPSHPGMQYRSSSQPDNPRGGGASLSLFPSALVLR